MELDLDMLVSGPGGNLSTSKLFELVLFLPRIGVDIGVLFSETSEESDIFECCKDDMWSEAERKEKEELEGLDIFLDLMDIGENDPLGDGFRKLLVDKDGLTRFEGLASWLLDPWRKESGVSLESLGRLEDILQKHVLKKLHKLRQSYFARIESKSSV